MTQLNNTCNLHQSSGSLWSSTDSLHLSWRLLWVSRCFFFNSKTKASVLQKIKELLSVLRFLKLTTRPMEWTNLWQRVQGLKRVVFPARLIANRPFNISQMNRRLPLNWVKLPSNSRSLSSPVSQISTGHGSTLTKTESGSNSSASSAWSSNPDGKRGSQTPLSSWKYILTKSCFKLTSSWCSPSLLTKIKRIRGCTSKERRKIPDRDPLPTQDFLQTKATKSSMPDSISWILKKT